MYDKELNIKFLSQRLTNDISRLRLCNLDEDPYSYHKWSKELVKCSIQLYKLQYPDLSSEEILKKFLED